jgi:hypothetical protein
VKLVNAVKAAIYGECMLVRVRVCLFVFFFVLPLMSFFLPLIQFFQTRPGAHNTQELQQQLENLPADLVTEICKK